MNRSLKKMLLSAMFLALGLVLPFFTGQIPQIGNALCPMHIPVLLCGFFWILGFPVSLCIGFKDHFDFKRLESAFKAEEAKSPK